MVVRTSPRTPPRAPSPGRAAGPLMLVACRSCNSWAEPDNILDMSDQGLAYERMFRAHYAAVYRYVLRRVEAPAVEDIVGETFLVAWRRFDDLAGDPLPWLLGT